MSALTPLLSKAAGRALDKVLPDEGARATAHRELEKILAENDGKEIEAVMQMRLAEIRSNDRWISRARPTFLYLIYAMIALCPMIGGVSIWYPAEIAAMTSGMSLFFEAIPGDLWALFGVGFVGYSAARTIDKVKGGHK
ncbi:MAG: 3TM-type holin [Pseudomonadota bacterium]